MRPGLIALGYCRWPRWGPDGGHRGTCGNGVAYHPIAPKGRVTAPDGAAEGSHGWSGEAQPLAAEPVGNGVAYLPIAPKGRRKRHML